MFWIYETYRQVIWVTGSNGNDRKLGVFNIDGVRSIQVYDELNQANHKLSDAELWTKLDVSDCFWYFAIIIYVLVWHLNIQCQELTMILFKFHTKKL